MEGAKYTLVLLVRKRWIGGEKASRINDQLGTDPSLIAEEITKICDSAVTNMAQLDRAIVPVVKHSFQLWFASSLPEQASDLL